ncbi:MAG: UbiA family prenyltransferase [Candidatus Diapherotrites archaeon]|nr:UbiA family prenyltransferase [Candidatus Diapherotrites archaeon]
MEEFFSKLAGKNKILNYLLLGRPWNGALIGAVAVLTYLLLSSNPSLVLLFSAFMTFLLFYMGGTTLNDVYDIEEDKHNMPFRPLSKKEISLKSAKLFAVLMYFLGFIFASVSFYLLLGAIVFVIVGVLYSCPPFRIDRKGIIANIGLAIATILLPALFGGFLAKDSFILPQNFLLLCLFMTGVYLSVTLIKDFKDVEGDKKSGKMTAAILYGPNKIIPLAILCAVLFIPLSVYYIYTFYMDNILAWFVGLITLLGFVTNEYILFNNPEPKQGVKAFAIGRLLAMFFYYSLLVLAAYHKFLL